jgi:hypothetical protein
MHFTVIILFSFFPLILEVTAGYTSRNMRNSFKGASLREFFSLSKEAKKHCQSTKQDLSGVGCFSQRTMAC